MIPIRKIASWPVYFILIVFVVAFAACHNKKADVWDDDMMGVWHTNAPDFKDRFIDIHQNLLILGTGENNPGIYTIKNIQKETRNDLRIFTLSCIAANAGEFTFELYVTSNESGPTFELKNQQQVTWYKSTH